MQADAQPNCYVHQQMNNYKQSSIAQACKAQAASEVSTSTATASAAQYQQIKLAMDVHAASIVVGRHGGRGDCLKSED
jgi:hypothetical protein